MDSLTPDKDDMERFRKERKRTTAVETQGSPITARRETPVKSEPARTPVRERTPAAPAPSRSGTSWVGVLALLVAIGLGGAGFWLYDQQRTTITQLEAQLSEANQYISQSKLVLARLEGSLGETEATVLQTDSKLTTRLAGIDSEIRKLWDLANKRNAAQIKEHQSQIAKLQTTSKQLQDRLAKAEQTVSGTTKTASEQATKLAAGLKTVEEVNTKLSQLEVAQSESLSRWGKEYQAQLAALTQRVEALRAKVDAQPAASPLEGRLKEVEAAIGSIDMSRQQVNRRVVDLERRLNEAQLKLDALSASGG